MQLPLQVPGKSTSRYAISKNNDNDFMKLLDHVTSRGVDASILGEWMVMKFVTWTIRFSNLIRNCFVSSDMGREDAMDHSYNLTASPGNL